MTALISTMILGLWSFCLWQIKLDEDLTVEPFIVDEDF